MTDPYDVVPYEGRAVPATHPERLAVAAMRAGRAPADPARASVLELGCAEGGNLVPMAYHLAEARFLGVDGSRAHVEAATEAKDRLGLDNLALRRADFRELTDAELGEHDYVIVHGVLSWVDRETQAVLLELVRRHLAPDGVAYLSYNCAAGWALKGELRQLLLRHTAALASPEEKIRASRELCAILAASPLREASLHAAALAERAEAALRDRDAYLLHEYLAPENHAFRQGEIRALCAEHGLAFVSELAHATSRADVEDDLERNLRRRYDDPVDVAELCDVMLGRAFRASLFCRAGARTDADAGLALLGERGVFRGSLRPEAKRTSLDAEVTETFLAPSGATIAVRHPALKAALLELARAWPRGLSVDDLGERAAMLLELRRVEGVDPRSVETRAELTRDLLELARLEHLDLRLSDPPCAREAPAAPRVEALTRFEAERSPAVTTPHHAVVPLDPFTRSLVRHLDGSRDRAELARRMTEHVEAGDLTLGDPSGRPLEGDARAAAIEELVERGVELLRVNALLTA